VNMDDTKLMEPIRKESLLKVMNSLQLDKSPSLENWPIEFYKFFFTS
jgi:hypothetical protein